MQDLAYFVMGLLAFMLLIAISTVVLAILTRLKKVPKVIGYVAIGVQAVLTVFAFQITTGMGLVSTAVLGICALLVFLDTGSKK
jgi:hypothetical protein